MKTGRLTTAMTVAASLAAGFGIGALTGAQNDLTSPGSDDASIQAVASETRGSNPQGDEAIEGAHGDETASGKVESKARGVNDRQGFVQAIRGIEGIDTIMLQNLETVLRMQDRPQVEQGKSGARTAAGLMMMEPTEEFEATPDARDEHMEFDLRGS